MKRYLILVLTLMLLTICVAAAAEVGAADAVPVLGVDLTPIFQAVIALLASLVTLKLIPWIKARTTAQQQEMLRATTSILVYAADQMFKATEGKQKLMYVKGKLAEKGYHVEVEEIEAAVRELRIVQGEMPAYPVIPEHPPDSEENA